MTAEKTVRFTVNGVPREISVPPRRTLLHALRHDLHLTGTKEGCGDGNCGSCTVIMDGRTVCSCCVLALEAEGSEILTIEGLAQGGVLHPIQRAFIDCGAIQCGFCTPGMVLQALVLLRENPHPTEAEIRRAIAGNLCRCTGYVKIVEAIGAAAEAMARQAAD